MNPSLRTKLFLLIHIVCLLSTSASIVWAMRVGPKNLLETQGPIVDPKDLVINTTTPYPATYTPTDSPTLIYEIQISTATPTPIATKTAVPTATPLVVIHMGASHQLPGESEVTVLTLASDVMKESNQEDLHFSVENVTNISLEVEIEPAEASCPGYQGVSLVDCLKQGHEDYSFSARAQLALDNGIINSLDQYGSANNAGINTALLGILTGKVG